MSEAKHSRKPFKARMHGEETRLDDRRSPFQRDKARIVHSAGFRRLQGKTQVMGVGEGDFHRTRLTHSIEVAQIGEGLLTTLTHVDDNELARWLPKSVSLEAACYAHDLGHPPYGHGGEKALHECMAAHGGFEGNAQTLRILAKLEKYRLHQGMNPTRRTVLGVLKYPVAYPDYDLRRYAMKPPKCYYDLERPVVAWALEPFTDGDRRRFTARGADDKPLHRSLDASLMECADDIAYAVHDLEDIVARRLVHRSDIEARLLDLFADGGVGALGKQIGRATFIEELFGPSDVRKRFIGRLVNLFVTEVKVRREDFDHPLLRLRAGFDPVLQAFLDKLKALTINLVATGAPVQQLERRGQRVIKALYDEMLSCPDRLIPKAAWEGLDPGDLTERRVCDYIAGMTDAYAEKVYHRLFTPGVGSSRDEL